MEPQPEFFKSNQEINSKNSVESTPAFKIADAEIFLDGNGDVERINIAPPEKETVEKFNNTEISEAFVTANFLSPVREYLLEQIEKTKKIIKHLSEDNILKDDLSNEINTLLQTDEFLLDKGGLIYHFVAGNEPKSLAERYTLMQKQMKQATLKTFEEIKNLLSAKCSNPEQALDAMEFLIYWVKNGCPKPEPLDIKRSGYSKYFFDQKRKFSSEDFAKYIQTEHAGDDISLEQEHQIVRDYFSTIQTLKANPFFDVNSIVLGYLAFRKTKLLSPEAAKSAEKHGLQESKIGQLALIYFDNDFFDNRILERVNQIAGYESQQAVLSVFVDLMQRADEFNKEIAEEYGFPAEVKQTAQKELRQRAQDACIDASQASSLNELRAILRKYKADSQIFASLFRAYTSEYGGEKALAEIGRISLETINPQDLAFKENQKLQSECENLFNASWRDRDPEAASTALQELRKSFFKKDSATRLHLLRRDKKIIAFVRFDECLDTSFNQRYLYAGSFNVEPALQKSTIGNTFFNETLKIEGRDQEIRAYVLADDDIAMHYVEKFGFVISAVETDVNPDGTKTHWFSISRDATLNKKLPIKSREITRPHGFVFSLPQDQEKMLAWVYEETNSGNVISCYLKINKDGKEYHEMISESIYPDIKKVA